MASKEDKKLSQSINKFRVDPVSIKKTMSTLMTGMEAMGTKGEYSNRLQNFMNKLEEIEPTKEISLSDELCEAAKKYLDKAKRKSKDDSDLILLRGRECKGKIPEKFVGENTVLIDSPTYSTPEQAVIQMLMDKGDPNNKDKKFLARSTLISDVPCIMGIAIDEEEDQGDDAEGKYCVILSDKGFDYDKDYVPKGAENYDLTELRLAFEALDSDGKGAFNIKDVIKMADDMGKNETDPTLYKMLKDLDDGKNEFITWPIFADFFTERFDNRDSKQGRKEIYAVFKPDEKCESVDYSQLKNIRDQINYKQFDDEKIKKMLESNTRSKYGVAFEDYCDNLDGKNGKVEEEIVPQKTATKTKRKK